MITYEREQQQTIPDSEVIIVGIGGAGANVIDRVALDGMENAEQLALNTDTRTLSRTVAKKKIQMGSKLTRGLGCGGDPELGMQAAMEVEEEIRDSLRGHKMVFVCVGLGGGTGSGAAPLVTRIARELGAFVVVFGTMPFNFEGRRRREQAETSLNELSVLANALVTFDNGRMGELVLASQGIHEAFAAADNMISESIRAVTRLVIKPGLVNVGLDDLMSSLRATRSRCLFGSGIATGENRSQIALKNAMNSPLLDKGRLLKNTQTALVHVCGGPEMTLYEVELLMRELSKTVPKDAHILFGAAVDDSMGDSLSVTIISSLPEEHVIVNESEEIEAAKKPKKSGAKNVASTKAPSTPVAKTKVAAVPVAAAVSTPSPEKPIEKQEVEEAVKEVEQEAEVKSIEEPKQVESEKIVEVQASEEIEEPVVVEDEVVKAEEPEAEEEIEEEELEPFAEKEAEPEETQEEIEEEPEAELEKESEPEEELVPAPEPAPEPVKKRRGIFGSRKDKEKTIEEPEAEVEEEIVVDPPVSETTPPPVPQEESQTQAKVKLELEEEEPEEEVKAEPEEVAEEVEETVTKKTTRVKARKTTKASDTEQGELLLDGGPRGKFEGEAPNLVDGEDLDIPPFLRKRR